MKKRQIILFCFIFISYFTNAQVVVSTCTAPTNIVSLYEKDAVKMCVKNCFLTLSPYKDSLNIDTALKSRYLKALLAVYNATSLPERNIVVNLNIHTFSNYVDPNVLAITANGYLPWMQNFANNIFPSGYTTLDSLLSHYGFQRKKYFYNGSEDIVWFETPTFYNMNILKNVFNTTLSDTSLTVHQQTDLSWHYGGGNIIDSLKPNFIDLDYAYRWGDCPAGCIYSCSYRFRVNNDCTVMFLGHSGDSPNSLLVGLTENTEASNYKFYPNPIKDKLTVEYDIVSKNSEIILYNALGQVVYKTHAINKKTELNLESLPSGFYTLILESNPVVKSFKVLKQ